MIINIIGIILTLLILSLLCSCGSRNQQKPPYRDDSYLYWNNATKCIEIYCGSLVIGSNRRRVGRYVPEQWRFQDGKWWDLINTPDSMGRVKLIFNEKESELLLLPLWAENHFYAWNGNDWACRGEYPKPDFTPSRYSLFAKQDSQRIEMIDFESHKKWYLESNQWIDDSSGIPNVPFKTNITVNSIHNPKGKTYIIAGIVEEFPMHRIYSITEKGNIKELGRLPTGFTPQYLCYNPFRERSVMIYSKDDHFGVCEIFEDQLIFISSINPPKSRFQSLFAYDHNSESIIMFGGFQDRYPILPDKYYQDTWALQYTEDRDSYTWKRIQ